jgi:PAS domain S-box-containing protein
MADSLESEREAKQLRTPVLETASTIFQIRQQAEQDIRRANELLEERTKELARTLAVMRAILGSTTDAIVVTDQKVNVTQFNEKFVDMWKISREALERGIECQMGELAKQNFADPRQFSARIEEIVTTGRESFDLLKLKDGRILERYSKVLIVEGQDAGRVWSHRDVTERYSAAITSRRLAAIVTSSDDAIIGKDLNSIITSWNYGAERIFGYTADEMIGTSVMRLIPLDRQAEEDEILSRIRRGERLDHFETIRVTKDGRRLSVSITVSPIKDSTGAVIGASKVARDISERKKAEAQAEAAARERILLLDREREARAEAERASRLKDEFLATLSHELRTPLNAVLGWANILLVEKLQEAERNQGLEIIERNARVQAQIIEDLLDMSRIISGKARLDVQRIELPTVLNESIDTLRATAEAKGVRLHSDIDPFVATMSGDPNRLQQVFWNLIHNAIKFTPKGGEIQVVLKMVESCASVSIVDTGEGIAPEFLPYIFDRFQQGDASTTRRRGGLGLGLSIAKQLVELHGGRVNAKSGGIDQGSTFTVDLPLVTVSTEPRTERPFLRPAFRESQPLPEVSLANVYVLVVDDEPDGRELVKRLLEMAGATVSIAGSASEAMERILARWPNVLVCDLAMPGEDGYSLVRRIQVLEESEGRRLPALAVSAYARSEDRTKAIRSGFQNYLAKPIDAIELLAVVSRLASLRG